MRILVIYAHPVETSFHAALHARVVAALRGSDDFRCTVVATGQHKEMFRQVADTFGFAVDADLDVMRPNQSLAGLTARLLTGIDGWLDTEKPDMALVQGDTTTVLAAFDKIIEGVRRANVDMATSGYWNSAQLILFNYNGTVTRGWDQMHANREASYPEMKDVKLEIRDKHAVMLGRDGAVVTCLWTQNQTFRGQPDSATGRMTLVFKRVGMEWKAVHLHTSPDNPDATRIPATRGRLGEPAPDHLSGDRR
jgi:ketosteroid isomerase-like protein